MVTYGSGAVAGTLCKDTLSIAGMTLPNHSFGVTTQVSVPSIMVLLPTDILKESMQFSGPQIPFDGLMGLSFSVSLLVAPQTQVDPAEIGQALSQQGVPTPIESLAISGQLKQAVLGIALGRVGESAPIY
jgi:cathepsin E